MIPVRHAVEKRGMPEPFSGGCRGRWAWSAALVLLVVLGSSCKGRPQTAGKAGVAMTFDDRGSIESWGEARAFLNENGIRATFFVDRPYAFSERHLEILKQLAKDGHEIGSHGWQHRKVTVFKKDGQLDAERYLAEEVLPSIRELERMGFSIRSFAYPSGESDPKVDALLLEHLDVLRTVDDRKARYVGPRQGGLVGAMTLDRRWRQGEIEELLDELAPVGGVLVLSGHKIGESRGYCWSAKMDIETIVRAVKARKLSFYTLGELAADRH